MNVLGLDMGDLVVQIDHAMNDWIGVAEAARLLGVGTSSVKRWADQGLLRCKKTPGRHRRFSRADVETLLSGRSEGVVPSPTRWQRLVSLLLAPTPPQVLDDELSVLRARLGSWWEAADAMGPVIAEVGRLWERGEISVLQEHLISERLARALARVAAELPWRPEAPAALLLTAEGDDHTLGLSLADVTIREAGWISHWAGRGTPLDEVRRFSAQSPLALIAASASGWSSDPAVLEDQARTLSQVAAARGITLVLGGTGAWPDAPPHGQRLHSFEELHRLLESLEAS